ncbi:TPA: hypothetical protein DEW47_01370 [Patescibacteria group bacterium]|nr:MAG: Formamidopyrimidine-DNA glycosylase [Parcubacteria group bacterium GW2011_GWF2_40_10]KKR47374.1 MAG: Formamidopyrimidine-DNA glycosylase [Parcubacteria group bacterium GW2011_GWA2_40_143]KKR59762.1 MAG: Formamidopyrimidine-DNA glycosylase [Parcubacteria group bacterium GW2011_GWC2_40_31]KKR75283.1 MAG: Formamidopyrimidine-DNA glycosylase [Parcubacteria group bacterium GW2011_GWB2_40_8]KKR77356.1 MAG: Formamidopyrimidine-DNA glycosylase [Parcubacteria group bacterium GW2011_GWE2_40_8]KK
MPELPEVQTTIDGMNKLLLKLKISNVWTDTESLFRKGDFKDFRRQVKDKTILSVERKGKNILINLSENKTILAHLKMTGHLMYGSWIIKNGKAFAEESGPISNDPYNRFVHVVFTLSDGKQLALSDTRKFAKLLVWETGKLDELEDIKNIGMDPFDKNFTYKKFVEIIKNKTARSSSLKIKLLLLDQSLVAGIGNIYADEILWQAGIHPAKEISKLSDQEIKKIYTTTKPILRKAIRAGGSSNSDYRDIAGEKGRFQNMQNVYRQTGKPCKKKDGGIITRIKIAGRSSHFCPIHQKM